MIVCIAVVGHQNNPLYMQSFTEADDALKFHRIIHCSLDVIDERVVQKRGKHLFFSLMANPFIQKICEILIGSAFQRCRISGNICRLSISVSDTGVGFAISEANDSQVKLVWYYNNALGRPEKKKFIARNKSYHGSTLIAASLSGLPALNQKFDLPVLFVLHTD